MAKTTKAKIDKKPMVKQTVVPKPKASKRPTPGRQGPAGRKGALGATSGY
jgi:hypothetical protein